MTRCSEARDYPFEPRAAFMALIAGLPRSPLQVVWSDVDLGIITAISGGDRRLRDTIFTIYLQSTASGETTVALQENHRGVPGTAHSPDFEAVFEIIDQSLRPADRP